MKSHRRWKDPRNERVWHVEAFELRRLSGSGLRTVLQFKSASTPRSSHRVCCCDGVAGNLDSLGDQSVALCLAAAIEGGYLWVDPRDEALWWVRPHDAPDGDALDFVSAGRRLRATATAGIPPTDPAVLMDARDRADPATA